MIVRDLRFGSKAIIRIYRNGVIIWEGGKKYTVSQLISVLTGFALVDTDYPVPIQMDADINAETVGKPFASDTIPGAYGKAELVGNVVPQPADTVNRLAQTETILAVNATPLLASYVYSKGQLIITLSTKGMPQFADTAEISGETTASLTKQASPTTQGITKMLFSTKSELNTVATHENAETLEKASLYSSAELTTHAGAYAWMMPELVDGVLIIGQTYSANQIGGLLEVK